MIGKLSGLVDSIDDGSTIIDVGGVGYVVTCSGRTLARLIIGEPAVLFIETSVREDAIQLFGFAEDIERQLFRLLMTVQGVGPKAALAVLGVLAADTLMAAIASGDRAQIARAPGIGAKLAGRIVSELTDRIGALAPSRPPDLPSRSGPATVPSVAGDAVSALVNLGFRHMEAFAAVSRTVGRLGNDAGMEALVKGSLADLAAKENSR